MRKGAIKIQFSRYGVKLNNMKLNILNTVNPCIKEKPSFTFRSIKTCKAVCAIYCVNEDCFSGSDRMAWEISNGVQILSPIDHQLR